MDCSMNYRRINANQIEAIAAPFPISIFANEDVHIEKAAYTELEELTNLSDTLGRFYAAAPEAFAGEPAVDRIVVTPDFHKGAGIPIGAVLKTRNCYLPRAMGSDIGCGMSLFVVHGISPDEVTRNKDAVVEALRRIFFGGARDIALNASQRTAILTDGIRGLLNAVPGHGALWETLENNRGGLAGCVSASHAAERSPVFETFCGHDKPSHDTQTGSIGGGNHFVEIQRVKKVFDRGRAWQAGLKEGSLVVMAHSGSLSVGSTAAAHLDALVKQAFPRGIGKPWGNFYPLPLGRSPLNAAVANIIGNAANFASVNRVMLGLMAVRALSMSIAPATCTLLHDAHHNFIEPAEDDTVIHRKGACRAAAGEYVIIPGSMGSSSFLLAGHGNEAALSSACHGAGRAYSRGAAMGRSDDAMERFMKEFTIVTPVDLRRVRSDVRRKKLAELSQEAPFAYKDITPAIETVTNAGMASPIAELFPVLTVKS